MLSRLFIARKQGGIVLVDDANPVPQATRPDEIPIAHRTLKQIHLTLGFLEGNARMQQLLPIGGGEHRATGFGSVRIEKTQTSRSGRPEPREKFVASQSLCAEPLHVGRHRLHVDPIEPPRREVLEEME